jgi:hypothetical protein
LRRHWGKALVGFTVSLLLLWVAVRNVSFAEVWTRIEGADFVLLGAAVFVTTSGFLIRAVRWKVLLTPVQAETRFGARWVAVCIGFMGNNLLPARVGEFARAYAFSRMETVSASAAFGSLLVERALDGTVLLLFLVIPVLTPGFPVAGIFARGLGAEALRFAVVVVGLMIVGLIVMAIWPRGFVRVGTKVATAVLPHGLARPLIGALEAFLDSVMLLRNPRLLALGFFWTLVLWVYNGFSFWLGMKAFGINRGLVAACFTQAVVGFGVALPSGPGFIGVFQAAAVFALSTVFGVERSRSVAFAFGYYVGGWIPITVIGLYYAWRLGMSLGDVGGAEERVETLIEEAHPEAPGTGDRSA